MIRGLEGTAPRKKRCRRYYGVAHGSSFREGIDPEERAYTHPWDGSKRCSGRMTWLIQKVYTGPDYLSTWSESLRTEQGDIITKDTKRNIELFIPATKHDTLQSSTSLYSCSLDSPPEYDDHPRQLDHVHFYSIHTSQLTQ